MNFDQVIEKLGQLIGELVDYRNILKMKGEDVAYIEQFTKDMRECRKALMEINRGKNESNRPTAN